MKISGRRRVAGWTAALVITILGAIIWAVLCAADFAHGDALGSLLHGVLAATSVNGAAYSLRKRSALTARR